MDDEWTEEEEKIKVEAERIQWAAFNREKMIVEIVEQLRLLETHQIFAFNMFLNRWTRT